MIEEKERLRRQAEEIEIENRNELIKEMSLIIKDMISEVEK